MCLVDRKVHIISNITPHTVITTTSAALVTAVITTTSAALVNAAITTTSAALVTAVRHTVITTTSAALVITTTSAALVTAVSHTRVYLSPVFLTPHYQPVNMQTIEDAVLQHLIL